MTQEAMKKEMNAQFAQAVLMFAVMDIKKNGANEPSDYMTPMLTAISALEDKFSVEELANMMGALAQVAQGMFGSAEAEA